MQYAARATYSIHYLIPINLVFLRCIITLTPSRIACALNPLFLKMSIYYKHESTFKTNISCIKDIRHQNTNAPRSLCPFLSGYYVYALLNAVNNQQSEYFTHRRLLVCNVWHCSLWHAPTVSKTYQSWGNKVYSLHKGPITMKQVCNTYIWYRKDNFVISRWMSGVYENNILYTVLLCKWLSLSSTV